MSDFPTDSDVEQHLQSLGLLVGALPPSLAGVAEVAIAHWQYDTGYSFWLPVTDTQEYEVRQGLIVPSSGIIRLINLTVNDTLLAPDQYRLQPRNFAGLRIPVQFIQVLSQYAGVATVEAVYGWSEESGQEVPIDVWQAVLLLACYLASSNLAESTATAGSLSSVQQGDVRYSFAHDNAQSRVQGWRQSYQWTVQRYRRMRVV